MQNSASCFASPWQCCTVWDTGAMMRCPGQPAYSQYQLRNFDMNKWSNLPSNLGSSGWGRSGLNTLKLSGSPCKTECDAMGSLECSGRFGCKNLIVSTGTDWLTLWDVDEGPGVVSICLISICWEVVGTDEWSVARISVSLIGMEPPLSTSSHTWFSKSACWSSRVTLISNSLCRCMSARAPLHVCKKMPFLCFERLLFFELLQLKPCKLPFS